MRLIRLLFIISVFQLACDENSPNDEGSLIEESSPLKLSLDSLGFEMEGGQIELDVMSELIWTTVDTSNWCSVHGDSLIGKGKLRVTIDENKNENSRSSTIFIYAGSEEARLTIFQKAFIHPALKPLDLGPLTILEGDETLETLVNNSQLSIHEISTCGQNPGSNSHNVVLMDAKTSRISVTWNHITTTTGEWSGISKAATKYNVSNKFNAEDEGCSNVPTFNAILVKKYGDWDHQHANGFFLAPSEQNVYMLGIDKIMIDFYYDLDQTSIPTMEELSEAYGLSGSKLEEWDKGLFNFDIQLHTKENSHAAFNLTLDPSLGNKWLRIEIPISSLKCWNSANNPISLTSISRHKLENISITAETGNRLVYRNINASGFNGDTPKLFKEIAFRIKRFELVRKEQE